VLYECPECGGILDVQADLSEVDSTIFEREPSTMWDYASLFPVDDPSTLGEGGTPLTPAADAAGLEGVDVDLYLKNEGTNPTCSFKDRPNALALSFVRANCETDTAIISSHGNAGASFAAYAKRNGLEPIVLVPKGSTAGLPKVKSYHPTTIPVQGDISDTYTLARDAAEAHGWYNGTTTHQVPLANQGNRTMAYELFAQLGGVPDWVLVPISAGPLLTQTYRGFEELQTLGVTDTLPAMVGVQASGCAPIATAYENDVTDVDEWHDVMDTVATSIEDPLRGYAKDGTYTLRIIDESGGAAVACDDGAIREAARRIVKAEGILAETASATPFVALEQLYEDGTIDPGDTVVGVVTGHGMNEVGKLAAQAAEREQIPVDVNALKRTVVAD
jgi:threonine synthase